MMKGPADDASAILFGQYGPRDRWLCNGHSHESCLDVTSISGISCLLSTGYLLTEVGGRSRSFRQAITPASHKGDNCYYNIFITPQRARGDTITLLIKDLYDLYDLDDDLSDVGIIDTQQHTADARWKRVIIQ